MTFRWYTYKGCVITKTPQGMSVDQVGVGVHFTDLHAVSSVPGLKPQKSAPTSSRTNFVHSGRRTLPLGPEAIAAAMPLSVAAGGPLMSRRTSAGLNDLLAVAPKAQPLRSRVAAMVSVDDMSATGPASPLRTVRCWSWKAGVRWLICCTCPTGPGLRVPLRGDRRHAPAVISSPSLGPRPAGHRGLYLGPSEAFRGAMDDFAHSEGSRALFERLPTSPSLRQADDSPRPGDGDAARLFSCHAGRRCVGAGCCYLPGLLLDDASVLLDTWPSCPVLHPGALSGWDCKPVCKLGVCRALKLNACPERPVYRPPGSGAE